LKIELRHEIKIHSFLPVADPEFSCGVDRKKIVSVKNKQLE